MFYSVCSANFSEPAVCVNVFLNKISAFFVAPFRIFAKCGRAAPIPYDFASFLGIVRRPDEAEKARILQTCLPRYVFSAGSAAVLGSSNVSIPNTPERFQVSPEANPAAPEDGRTPLKR